MDQHQSVFRCVLCGNLTVHDVLLRHGLEDYLEEYGWRPIPFSLILSKCRTCREEALYTEPDEGENIALWPKDLDLGAAVPASVRELYIEANAIRTASPNAFAVLIRRALEAICEEQKAIGRNLSESLEDLTTKRALPTMVKQIAKAVRLIGNLGAHHGQSAVSASQVEALEEFFLGIVEYVYTAPARLVRFDELLKSLPAHAGGSNNV